jgi:hypothetical protein
MQRRGYAIAFLLVLVASCVGAYVGARYVWERVSGDFQTRGAWTPPATGQVAEIGTPAATTRPQPSAALVPTATRPVIPTPEPLPFPTPEPLIQYTLAPTPSPQPIYTVVAPVAGPGTATVAPTAAGAFSFALTQAVRHTSGDCGGRYIRGTVVDKSGRALPDIRVVLVDEFGNSEAKLTKGSGADAGHYDFPVFGPARRFFLNVLDPSGRPLSPQIEIQDGLGPNAQATCHWVDWTRQQ